ncbi:MAG: serine hydrolase [Cyclobacteriaceae bacterium]|nr:serine hydrolase [Cyclobacteriaceae bacterium]
MRPFFWIVVACLLTVDQAFAQPIGKEIEQYIEKTMLEWAVPGMAVAIVKDGKIISSRGYGVLKEGEKARVDDNTLFAIASNTKAFVSSALGVLQDEGKLRLDDRVQSYLPEFQLYHSYASHEARIEDLLCHRLGLGTYSGDIIWYKSDFSAREVVSRIRYVPQAYSFRAGYGYSNLMFIAAGEVIMESSGMPWDQFVRERFLVPLGMDRTICSSSDLQSKGNYAIPHKPDELQNTPIAWVNWDNMGAAGGIISSANDMAKWLMLQLNRGIWNGDTILNPSTQNILWTPHNNHVVSDNSKKFNPGTKLSGYGLGWSVSDFYGHRLISHGGGYDGMYSLVAMIPELNLGIVILTNTMKSIATPIRQYVFNAYLPKENKDWSTMALERAGKKSDMLMDIESIKKARVAGTSPTVALDRYAGMYHSNMLGNIHISHEDERLTLSFEHAPGLSASLRHWHYDTWEILWEEPQAWFDFGTVQFNIDNSMRVQGLVFDVPNEDIFFHELKVTKTD